MSATTLPPRHVARWTAIGCTVHVETRRARDLEPARALVGRLVSDLDEVASRFRDDSDLSRVNHSPGRWVRVDPLLVEAVRVALRAAEATDGLVDPLLGRPLVELGYDRTFRELREVSAPVVAQAVPPAPGAWREIALAGDAVRIPDGTALDLGATAKAWCTDLAAGALGLHLDEGAVVSIGGDLRTSGPGTWQVAVSERPDEEPATLVELHGALATSSTRVRRWTRHGRQVHHLLDPRTGQPVDEVWRTVSIAAGSCVEANAAATAAIVRGADAIEHLAGVPAARLVDVSGHVRLLGTWPDDLAPSAPDREEGP